MKQSKKILGLALHVCDEVIVDKKTSKKSLIGMFNHIIAKKFPCTHPQLHVFLALTGARGKNKAELRCVKQDTMEPILGATGEVQSNNPNAIIEVDFALSNVTFPSPGKYAFQFLCDDELVFDRPFIVSEQGGKK